MIEAMADIEAIPDPQKRARAISELLSEQTERTPNLRELRRQDVADLRERGMSYRGIAAEIGVSLGTVQDILRGHSGPWGNRPRKNSNGDAVK